MERSQFSAPQTDIADNAVAMAEELVNNFYKMSSAQWLHSRYDVKTLADLSSNEIVDGPFAQVIRYEGQRQDMSLGSAAYDFYKICLQDHAIISVLARFENIKLFPFALYIITHELIHIVRFSKFLQSFEASTEEAMDEEKRVHRYTRDILGTISVKGLPEVLNFYRKWQGPWDEVSTP